MPYGLVPMPQQTDPLRSLSEMMTLGSNLSQFQTEQHDAGIKKRAEKAINDAKGDPMAAATLLERQGDFSTARTLRQNAEGIRAKTLDTVMGRLNEHQDALGKLEEMGVQAKAHPELYAELRPQMVSIASTLDGTGDMAAKIPEQYDPASVDQGLTWLKGAASATQQRLRAAAALKEKNDARLTADKAEEADRKVISDWFSVSPNQEDWDHSLAAAQALGVSPTMLSKVGPTWSKGAMETARTLGLEPKDRVDKTPTTFQAAILEAQGKGDAATVASLTKLAGTLAAAQRAPETPMSADMVETVRANPAVWADLSPSVRDKMLGPLSKGTFDWKAATSGLTDAQKATAERWMQDQLGELEREITDRTPTYDTDEGGNTIRMPSLKPEITPAQIEQRKLSIYNSYRTQTGMKAVDALPKEWGGQKRTATATDVKNVAAKMGISEAKAKAQLEAAGVTIQP